MIKQPYQALKWYNGAGEQQYYYLINSDTNFQMLKYHTMLPPSFVIKRDERMNLLSTWTLRSVDGAVNIDMTSAAVNPGYATYFYIAPDSEGFDYLVWQRFPTITDIEAGFYYYEVSDTIETWYSEVFELCDIWTHLMTGSTNRTPAWNTHTATNQTNRLTLLLAETAANGARNISNSFTVAYKEKLQLYIFETLNSGTEGVQVWLENAANVRISSIYTLAAGVNDITLTPLESGTAHLAFEYPAGNNINVTFNIWLYYWYVATVLDKKYNTVLRWTDTENFCGLPYSLGIDNYLILDGLPFHNYTKTEETATEDDEKNKYPLIQTYQKWYNFVLAAGEHFIDGMGMLRLHDTITMTPPDGMEVTVVEIDIDTRPIDDYMYEITLDYREDSCSRENCGFTVECCCPSLDPVLDYIAGGLAGLPAQPCCNGDRYMVHIAGTGTFIYESDGAAWNRMTDEEVDGECVLDLDADASDTYATYWYYNGVVGTEEFEKIVDLQGVTDLTDGYANIFGESIRTTDTFDCKVWIQGQIDTGGGFTDIGEPVSSNTFDTSGITVSSGVGNFDFRVRIIIHNCIDTYDGDINQTITA